MRHLPILSLILFPTLSHAADFDGASLSLFWGAPFALILLSIALGPLFFAHTWHHHFGKITAFWTLLFLVPFALCSVLARVCNYEIGRASCRERV